MTQDYGYKVTLRRDGCGSQQFVAFHDEQFLDYAAAGEEAVLRKVQQRCPRCREHHEDEDYFPMHVERGEPDIYGEIVWRDAYPTRVDEWAHPELFA